MNPIPGMPPISERFLPYVHNLSEIADRDDRMPFIGRAQELEAVIETLQRRLKRNVVLVGRPGVGKTALITELAARINRGECPANLHGKVILELAVNSLFFSSGSLEQAAKEFERFFAEVLAQRDRVILFLDELQIPTAALPGGRPPQLARVQALIRSHLAGRDIQMIAAATPEEYLRNIQLDEMLSSSLSAVNLLEPTVEEMCDILSGICPFFGRYYSIEIPRALFDPLLRLAARFVPHRAFPDKAIELLDIACSKASLKGHKVLAQDYVEATVAETSHLPIEIVRVDPEGRVRELEGFLQSTTINQRAALAEIARIFRLSMLRKDDPPGRPGGVFLFLGPAGTGKSYVAQRMAEFLFGSEEKLRLIDLSGLTRATDAARLVQGDSPDAKGTLIQQIYQHPFAVILFEGLETAHPQVLTFLGKALRAGEIVDAFGKRHPLSSLIFILSLTGIGEEREEPAQVGFLAGEKPPQLFIPPKFVDLLEWVDEVIEFVPLSRDHLKQLAMLQVDRLREEVQGTFSCQLEVTPAVVDLVLRESAQAGEFARSVNQFVEREIRRPVMDRLVACPGGKALHVVTSGGRVKVVDGGERKGGGARKTTTAPRS